MQSPYILMLEYDEDDQYITEQYFQGTDIPLKMVSSSDELLEYLRRCAAASFPSLILLDYHSTPLNAKEILQKLKATSSLSHIPVIVLSGTLNKTLIKECYANGASSFILKPASVESTNKKISNFIEYWFRTVELINK